MINSHKFSYNPFLILSLIFSLFFLMPIKVFGNIYASGRVLTLKTYPFAPVEILELRINDSSIRFNEKLSEDNDWLKDLRVQVKNISDKAISYISIELRNEPPESGDKPRITAFSIGSLPVSRNQLVQQAETLVSPEAFIDIPLPQKQYEIYKDYLQVSSLEVSIGQVFFTDDTLWTRGVLYTRDPKNSNKWNPIKSSVEKVEEFYLQKRQQRLTQSPDKPPKSSLLTYQPVAFKSKTKSIPSKALLDCHILSDSHFYQCDYLCPDWYFSYTPPLEYGRWRYYEVYYNCSGPAYCYPYQNVTEVQLCW